MAIAVHIPSTHINSTGKSSAVGKQFSLSDSCHAVKHFDVWSTSGARSRDDVSIAVSVDVASSDIHTPGKACAVRKELTNHGAISAVEYSDMRTFARTCAGNNIGPAIAVDVCRGNADTSSESC